MKHITTYSENGRTFEIVYDGSRDAAHRYWGFEDKYIDASGKLTRQFNGLSGHLTESAEHTIQLIHYEILTDALIAEGFDRQKAATMAVLGISSDEYDERMDAVATVNT